MYISTYMLQPLISGNAKMSFMACSRFIFLFFLVLPILANCEFLKRECIDSNGNYSENSSYKTNLELVLSNLSPDAETQYNGGFYNLSAGNSSPDRVNAIALCRGDVSPAECYSCLNDSTADIVKECPNQREAIIWYDNCMLRYSDRSILGAAEDSPELVLLNVNNATSVDEFNEAVSGLLSNLSSSAASGGSLRKFATGSTRYSDFQTIYALVQCTPDLSKIDCNNCLVRAIGDMPGYFQGRVGGRIVRPSCFFLYEVNKLFYNDPPPPLPTSPPQSSPATPSTDTAADGDGDGTSQSTVIIIVVVAMVLIVCICIGIFVFLRKRRTKKSAGAKGVDDMTSADSLQFDFETIREATGKFSDENKLGQGGFGAVYKGKLSDGQEIAVKRLSQGSGQGDLEFKNEVLLVAKLQHRNLVRLLGFCLEYDERLLIYEFMPNISLDYFLFDSAKREQLNWERRYKIIGGTARGLVYLHEDSRLRIIHRDMKASNILLDAEMNPKIADFGMARLFIRDQTQGATSRIVGTYGYMAPEYAMHGQFSVKSDVFSFGVLVLEIVSGQRNNSFRLGDSAAEDLLGYAWRNWREGTPLNIIDPLLRTSAMSEMMRCIHIGLLCVQHNVADRPTMSTIVLMLNSYSLTLPIPSQPAFFADSSSEYSRTYSSQLLSSGGSEPDRSRIKNVQLSANEASMSAYMLRDDNV